MDGTIIEVSQGPISHPSRSPCVRKTLPGLEWGVRDVRGTPDRRIGRVSRPVRTPIGWGHFDLCEQALKRGELKR